MKKQSVVVGALLLSAVCRGADYEPSSRLALGGISHNDTSNYWPLEIK